jgi:outer membrane scaffolding protein for murein synthesis (MipA/OmpV family)
MLGVTGLMNWQDRRYAAAFFSVDAADAAVSGLPAFTATSGVRDLGVSLFVDRQLSRHWSATITGSFNRLQSAAARSPIVADRGSSSQAFAGLSASYKF